MLRSPVFSCLGFSPIDPPVSPMKAACTILSTLLVISLAVLVLFAAITGVSLPGSEVVSRHVSHSGTSTVTSTVVTVGSFPFAYLAPWLVGTAGLCFLIFGLRYRSSIVVHCTGAICAASLFMPIPLALTAGACVAGIIVFRREFFGTKPPPLPRS